MERFHSEVCVLGGVVGADVASCGAEVVGILSGAFEACSDALVFWIFRSVRHSSRGFGSQAHSQIKSKNPIIKNQYNANHPSITIIGMSPGF